MASARQITEVSLVESFCRGSGVASSHGRDFFDFGHVGFLEDPVGIGNPCSQGSPECLKINFE